MASHLQDTVIDAFRRDLDRELQTAPARPRWRGPLRALCVDDNEDAADSLAAVLDLFGCETRVCYSGAEALDAFNKFRPHGCFLDLMMPKMNGLELAGRIRALAGAQAVFLVAVTALGSLEDRTRTAITGFHYHLTKPASGRTLAELVTGIETMFQGRGERSPSRR